jgi:DNA-binding cell septation regulator SpoVG
MIPIITSVTLTPASADLISRGLLGWITCTLDHSLVLDGIALRRTRTGRLALSWPARRDGAGRDHPVVRPLHDHARHLLEQQILGQLGGDVRGGAA